MPASKLRIALVILEDERGHIAMQLRSNIPGIVNPDRWGVFGGHIEAGESPLAGAVREVEEELTCSLDPAKMRFLAEGQRSPESRYFLFHYIIHTELHNVQLTEGERWALLTPEQIQDGRVDGKEIVSYHRAYILAYWNGDYAGGAGRLEA